ncbi:MAG: nucleotide exchange factor GrpE [Planctomycetota bacterium]
MKQEKAKKSESNEEKRLEMKLEKLEQELDTVTKEKNELFEKLQRLSADYANFQKRVPKQIADTLVYEKEEIIKSLLPVLDNFEHTLKNMESNKSSEEHIKGVQIVFDHMLDVLRGHGLGKTKSLGETFDPARHQAMTQRDEPDKVDKIILEEFQAGYTLNNRVIRAARVVINKHQPVCSAEQADEPINDQPQTQQKDEQQQVDKDKEG